MSLFRESFLLTNTPLLASCFHFHSSHHLPLEKGSRKTKRTSRVPWTALGALREFGILRISPAIQCQCTGAFRRCWRRECTRGWRNRWRPRNRSRRRPLGTPPCSGSREEDRRTLQLRRAASPIRSLLLLRHFSVTWPWSGCPWRQPYGPRWRNSTADYKEWKRCPGQQWNVRHISRSRWKQQTWQRWLVRLVECCYTKGILFFFWQRG